jgi:thioredoxin reductase (NADPH)
MTGRKKICKDPLKGGACDVVIIGAGPAGLAAGIYGARAGLKCFVLEKGTAGGQVMLSPWIENYPGFPKIEGMKLMETMAAHAREYVQIIEGVEVIGVELKGDEFKITTSSGHLTSRGIILATGASHKKLLVPGEEEYYGKGVSYCATCDGFFFRKKKVVVIGGGNTAITEALYLLSIGCDVTLVHRRESLRADRHLQDTANEKGLKIRLNTIIEKILGDGNSVTAVELSNQQTSKKERMDVDGVFVAVGTVPGSALAKSLCLETDARGWVKVDRNYRTNMPFVYAAGDLVGGILQIVSAVHGGAVAALSAFEDLADPYYTRTRSGEKAACPLPSKKN